MPLMKRQSRLKLLLRLIGEGDPLNWFDNQCLLFYFHPLLCAVHECAWICASDSEIFDVLVILILLVDL